MATSTQPHMYTERYVPFWGKWKEAQSVLTFLHKFFHWLDVLERLCISQDADADLGKVEQALLALKHARCVRVVLLFGARCLAVLNTFETLGCVTDTSSNNNNFKTSVCTVAAMGFGGKKRSSQSVVVVVGECCFFFFFFWGSFFAKLKI